MSVKSYLYSDYKVLVFLRQSAHIQLIVARHAQRTRTSLRKFGHSTLGDHKIKVPTSMTAARLCCTEKVLQEGAPQSTRPTGGMTLDLVAKP
jgi:hypothetical protein